MHPCSQPRYGFRLVSKPTSGLVLRVIIDFVPSRKYCVRGRGVSSVSQPASTASGSVKSTCSLSNRLAGLHEAARPRIAVWLCGFSRMTGEADPSVCQKQSKKESGRSVNVTGRERMILGVETRTAPAHVRVHRGARTRNRPFDDIAGHACERHGY